MSETIRLAQPGDKVSYTTFEGLWGTGIVSDMDYEPEFFYVKVMEGIPEHDADVRVKFPHTVIWTRFGDVYTVIPK